MRVACDTVAVSYRDADDGVCVSFLCFFRSFGFLFEVVVSRVGVEDTTATPCDTVCVYVVL